MINRTLHMRFRFAPKRHSPIPNPAVELGVQLSSIYRLLRSL